MFEEEFEDFVRREKCGATGRRLEMLEKDLTGTKVMFREALWPVFKSFDGFTLEFELVTSSGVNIYVDAFYRPRRLAFESEGFVSHAQNITRDRFCFERNRIRTLAKYGLIYIPFAWDELDKKAEACRNTVFELLGRFGGMNELKLSLYEREALRYSSLLSRPFRVGDISRCLQKCEEVSRTVIKQLMVKKLIRPVRSERQRHHEYVVEEAAWSYLS